MATDYILFVHGVRQRSRDNFIRTSQGLLKTIRDSHLRSDRPIKPIYLFWGDLNVEPQDRLRDGLQASPQWPKLWMQQFRSEAVLEFVGDAALYLSRHVGAQVVRRFHQTMQAIAPPSAPGDRLHLVTHSMGTVILFDLLFAARWEDPRLDADVSTQDIRPLIAQIRNTLFGLGSDQDIGIPIASIHTLGSPLAMFSLLSVTGESTHDLTSNLQILLQKLYRQRGLRSLPWYNLIHPGDPIAYPLQGVMAQLLGTAQLYVHTRDVITERTNPLINIGLFPLLKAEKAHNSYWQNRVTADTIANTMRLHEH
ncbi:MAG: hypothetical protein AAF892_06745 [Cyanobacteria bacterium P01_D01_bin.71]